MPLLLVSLLLQIGLATHAVRTGRSSPWLWIILFAPGLGCLLYVAIEIIPEFLHGPAGQRAASDAAKVIAPEREYRRLLALVEVAPTVENMSQLAAECLRLDRAQEAVTLLERCATGIHAGDPKLLLMLAQAHFAAGSFAETLSALDALRSHNPDYQSAEGHMLYARALEQVGRPADALREYVALSEYFPGEEARCRYGLLLQSTGAIDEAIAVFAEIARNVERRGSAYRRAEKTWYETARRMLPT